jgi:hypothetical protein
LREICTLPWSRISSSVKLRPDQGRRLVEATVAAAVVVAATAVRGGAAVVDAVTAAHPSILQRVDRNAVREARLIVQLQLHGAAAAAAVVEVEGTPATTTRLGQHWLFAEAEQLAVENRCLLQDVLLLYPR